MHQAMRHAARRQGRRRLRIAVLWLAAVAAMAAAPVRAADMKLPGALAADGPPAARATPSVTPPRQCICTREYRPVCGRMPDGRERTISNACMAGCFGATVIRPGAC